MLHLGRLQPHTNGKACQEKTPEFNRKLRREKSLVNTTSGFQW